MAKPRVDLWSTKRIERFMCSSVPCTHKMHEFEEPLERSYAGTMEYLERFSSEMQSPWMQHDFRVKSWQVPVNKYQVGLVGYERKFLVRGGPGALKNMHGTFKRGILFVATFCFTSMLQVLTVRAIAPETARDGFVQAGNSKAETSNFWYNVVACVGVVFGIIAAIVAIMQLRQSRRRNQIVTTPTQQMLTMQRRSSVQYTIVEEETVHLIDEMA